MLRSFLAVAREGNVTRAATSLHITQPALSRQLAELERELGRELVVREPRGVSLTDEGVHLRRRAEEIVELADRTELEMRSPAALIEGDVWVGGGETRAMSLVAKAAARMADEHPGVRIRLHSGNADDVIERIDRGLLDFGLVIGREPERRHESLELPWEDRWVVLMRRDDPLASCESLTTENLRGQRLIVSAQQATQTEEGSSGLSFLGREGYDVAATFTLLYNASLMVEEGLGMAVTFEGIVRTGEGTPFAVVPLTDLVPQRSRLFWKRFQPLTRASELFLKTMRELAD